MPAGRRRRLVYAFAALAAFAVSAAAADGAPASRPGGRLVARIAMDDFPPYISRKLPGYGPMARMIEEAFALRDVEVEFHFVPWKRALTTTEAGGYEGTPAWFATPEREAAFYVSPPLVDDSQSFFYLKEKPFDWRTVADLGGLSLGATAGYDYGPEFAAAAASGRLSVQWVATDLQAFKMLLSGRIAVFPMNTHAGRRILAMEFPVEAAARVAVHPRPLRVEPLHLLLTRKQPLGAVLAARFEEGFAELKASGRYARLIAEIEDP